MIFLQQDIIFGSFVTNKSLKSNSILLLHRAVLEEKEVMGFLRQEISMLELGFIFIFARV